MSTSNGLDPDVWRARAKAIDLLRYIRLDLEEMTYPPIRASFPVLLTVFSGIDLLGVMERGYWVDRKKRNRLTSSNNRCTGFITIWMGRIRPEYLSKTLAKHLYKGMRCPMTHNGNMGAYFEVSNHPSYAINHLCFTEEGRLMIHAPTFAYEFLEALACFLGGFLADHDNALNANSYIKDMLDDYDVDEDEMEEVKQHFDDVADLYSPLPLEPYPERVLSRLEIHPLGHWRRFEAIHDVEGSSKYPNGTHSPQ